MRYARLRSCDISNGPGMRASLFVQGCTNKCKGCFNPETWDFSKGKELIEYCKDQFVKAGAHPSYSGWSILGGEPFDQPMGEMLDIAKRIKSQRNAGTLWVWTGYVFEELIKNESKKEFLQYVDVLVDGRFVLEKRDLNLRFRGSSNQRIIDINKSLQSGVVVLWKDTTRLYTE